MPSEQTTPLRWDIERRAWRGTEQIGRVVDLKGSAPRWHAQRTWRHGYEVVGEYPTLRAAKKAVADAE